MPGGNSLSPLFADNNIGRWLLNYSVTPGLLLSSSRTETLFPRQDALTFIPRWHDVHYRRMILVTKLFHEPDFWCQIEGRKYNCSRCFDAHHSVTSLWYMSEQTTRSMTSTDVTCSTFDIITNLQMSNWRSWGKLFILQIWSDNFVMSYPFLSDISRATH